MSQSRQLAAIMFTDIVGYTALMGKDEQKAFELLRKNREIHKPLIKQFHGTWIKELGDGMLASFHTVTDAVICAAAIHKACSEIDGLQLRIGIHLGEVVFENNDVFGDGVNIASRLQPLAPIGGTLISEAVYKNVINRTEFITEFVKEETLKNVKEPVKTYEIKVSEILLNQSKALPGSKKAARPLSIKNRNIIYGVAAVIVMGFIFSYFLFFRQRQATPSTESKEKEKSIVVIPFRNMSSDPQQEYFAEGMMDEVLNHLYKIGDLNIISRTTSMAYKDTKKKSKEIAGELGVVYLLEGSVQKEGDSIRFIVQLIDGTEDKHLWGETYDRKFKEVFAIQSEIAQKIAVALKIKIDPETKNRIEFIPTENTSAYNLYLLSKEKALKDHKSWKELLIQVIQLDPSFAPAYADLALYWLSRGHYKGDLSAKQVLDSSLPLLKTAIQLDSNLSSARYHLALVHLWFEWDFKAAEKEWEKFFQLNPSGFLWVENYVDFLSANGRYLEALNFARKSRDHDKKEITNWTCLATSYYYMNQPGEALKILDSASLFSKDPLLFEFKAEILIYLGKYEQVITNLNKDFEIIPDNYKIPRLRAWLAISYFHIGRANEAQQIVDSLQFLSKETSIGSPAFHLAIIYAAMGRKELAIQFLEKGYKNHEVEMFWLKAEPLFYSLQDDPKIKMLLNQIGFK